MALVINIPDVYNSTEYDFSGPRNYDAVTGFKTKLVLVVPMENMDGEITGVVQLINREGRRGQIAIFGQAEEQMVQAIALQAAIAIANIKYADQITQLLDGKLLEEFKRSQAWLNRMNV